MSHRRDAGLAVIGCGTVGRIRAMIARDHPGVGWIGLCDRDEAVGRKLAADCAADLFTTNAAELVTRPEVDAVIVATDENEHEAPTLAAVRAGRALFIEKPLATSARGSARVLAEIQAHGVDAVVGYTQRFRRRFLVTKAKLESGAIGEVTTVVTRAFMNRMVPLATLRRTAQRATLTPIVVSGTHSVDLCMWLMEGKTPATVYARSTDRSLGEHGTKDATLAIVTMTDGTIWSMNISWALPIVWPGSVYGLEIGIVGTDGVLDIEDTHRDTVLASEHPQPAGYAPEGFAAAAARHVDFLTSYPPGDLWAGQLWGPMREETTSWLTRLTNGLRTPHASAADGHRNLLLTMAIDLSARRGTEIALPADPAELDTLLAGEPA
ncbi:Gfo/Idh/MocA family oxidoreductase [Phytohabitans sp. ZYX-F-186]|uniref:Gfo/Idh/MocA family oxidoreductase n=1 Tax=Phytohabitans maris TaxID=3071409 RepID=A0ABU0ZTP2_9ACTN|nr:Gfo/Idh/MocA family oxidoreductase [Phytohabitans sp. ZYX-F-186]MDQ7910345.1 Gfo/Idh/MocA family oxidoreductase [Phytohabitans sp. ZYX-F-186]